MKHLLKQIVLVMILGLFFYPCYSFAANGDVIMELESSDGSSGAWVVDSNNVVLSTFASNGNAYIKGNLGIGTGTPKAKLEVSGTILRSGSTSYETTANSHINLAYSSITGANGQDYHYITIAGGSNNIASATHAVICGGSNNTASVTHAAICGGSYNDALSDITFIGGGTNNTASGYGSAVSGGWDNTASGQASYIGGGNNNKANGQNSSISGGNNNDVVSGNYSSISGGFSNTASGNYSSISGGESNNASGGRSAVLGGGSNIASGIYSSISGGLNNTASGQASYIGGGNNNKAQGQNASISCGNNNSITVSASYSSISGGFSNIASGNYSSIPGGMGNTAGGYHSFAGGRYMSLTSNATGSFVWGYANSAIGIPTPYSFLIFPYGTSGNVGISLTNPSERLEVNGNIKTAEIITSSVSASGADGLYLLDDGNNGIFIKDGGKVGINTTNPSSLLTVGSGSAVTQGIAVVTDDVSTDKPAYLELRRAGSYRGFIAATNTGIGMGYQGTPIVDDADIEEDSVFFIKWLGGETLGNVGIGTTSPIRQLDINGQVHINDLPAAGGVAVYHNGNVLGFHSSSRRYKKDIQNMNIDIDNILKMQPVVFRWKKSGEPGFGLIAEDVEKLINPLVYYNKKGQVEGIHYEKVGVILIEAVKALKKENDELRKEIKDIKEKLAEINK